MFKHVVIAFSLSLAACGGVTHAATLPVPTVEYSADRIIESEAGTFAGRVYSAQGKDRMETSMGGMQSVMILRRDKQVGWMLMPMQKMYQEMDLAQARQQTGAAPDDQVEVTEVGSDSIEGFAATKYKMVMKDGSAGGFVWITAEGIAVKLDMLGRSGRDKMRITMTLKNLSIGAQDASLFELPAGYGAMGGALGMSRSPFSVGKALKGAFSRLQ